jgi:heterodisulfide reductase subunit B
MRYSYYPGCTLETSNRAYDLSARSVSKSLGIELSEIKDWNCCGATAYMSVREMRSFALSARNLALAEKEGLDIVTVCNGCFTVLNKTNRYMAENKVLCEKIRNALKAVGLDYKGTIKVRHLLDVLVNDVGEIKIRDSVRHSLSGLKVAPYYGCQISRPYGTFDDPEFPTTLDTLFTWLGASPVFYPYKAKCCGGMMMTIQPEIALKLIKELLVSVLESGAECIATACPLCQINLEAYQTKINKKFKTNFSLPIFYFTQLAGLALGLGEDELKIEENLTKNREIAEKVIGA